ncbi:6634_t:CDS:2, partial [Gigaspora margarita]
NSQTEAKKLSCLFKFLIGDYSGSELAKCETLENQKWWHADAPMVVNKAKALQLEKVGDFVFFIPMKKNKKKIESSNNEPNFCDFEIQVSLPNSEYIEKINKLERLNKKLLLENEILKK